MKRRFEAAERAIDKYLEDKSKNYSPKEPPASDADDMGVQDNPVADPALPSKLGGETGVTYEDLGGDTGAGSFGGDPRGAREKPEAAPPQKNCPYCGSDDTQMIDDDTYECHDCGNEFDA